MLSPPQLKHSRIHSISLLTYPCPPRLRSVCTSAASRPRNGHHLLARRLSASLLEKGRIPGLYGALWHA